MSTMCGHGTSTQVVWIRRCETSITLIYPNLKNVGDINISTTTYHLHITYILDGVYELCVYL
jgi:hypothetical protein